MSWSQPRQPTNLVQEPPPLTSLQPSMQQQQVDVSGSNDHGMAPPFVSQPMWQQNYHQQSMQPPVSNNNWAPNPLTNNYQQPENNMAPPPLQHQMPPQNVWPQQGLHPPSIPQQPAQPNIPTSGYFLNPDNFLHHQQEQLYAPPSYPPPPPEHQRNIQHQEVVPTIAPAKSVSYSRQSTQPMDNVQAPPDNYEKKGHNNNDGWGDWDWNDNSIEQPPLNQQQLPVAASVQGGTNTIEDSFQTKANDNWQLGLMENSNKQNTNLIPDELHQNRQEPVSQESVTVATMQSISTGVPHPSVQSATPLVKPTNLPIVDAPTFSESSYASNNIPSPVYVSQAKPVPKPPRQYASPPEKTNDIVNAIGPTTPPHAFQNNPEPQQPATTAPPPIQPTPLPPSVNSSGAAGSNPFKKTGLLQHHRAGIIPTSLNSQQSNIVTPPAQFYTPPPPPPEGFANPSVENNEVITPDNSEILHENQEVAPNNDRNEYLQTSHLSEMSGHADTTFNITMQEQNNESDSLPPPGLSRLVLGQPENESRHVPGIEDENILNIERQADGEDNGPAHPRPNYTSSSGDGQRNASANQIDITADRNLYLVPGESDVHEQRFVTGLENGSSEIAPAPPIQVEQRELELDGENIEDQQQPIPPQIISTHHNSNHHLRPVSPVPTIRDQALEGANSLDRRVQGSLPNNLETESGKSQDTNVKDLSNLSTENDESDQRIRSHNKTRRGLADDNKKRRPGNEIKEKRYESEESDYSSDRELRRYRDDIEDRERDRNSKERKKYDRRERDLGGDRDRDRYKGEERQNRYRDKYFPPRDGKVERGDRYGGGRYEVDSKYETEGSSRHERRKNVDREAYEQEQYRRYRQNNTREKRETQDRRGGRGRGDVDRRRSDKDYRDDRDPRRHQDHREKNRGEYEEYRKASSRSARESDIEKESRTRDKDLRYPGHNMYSGYSGYGYDPYAAYYYEQMVRTNPQAYSEWYKKYYGQVPVTESIANNGRESVHSGRSSANNEKDRYSMQHQQYNPYSNDYQGHFMHPASTSGNMSVSLNSTMIEQQFQQPHGAYSLSRGPSTGNLSSASRSCYVRSEYSDLRPDNNLSINLANAANNSIRQDPQRLTPFKYSNSHPVISLGPGLMVAVKPKYSSNGITNVVKIFKTGINDATNKLFQQFPGPLVRGITHKKTIIEFCEDQIRLGPLSAVNRSRQNSTNSLSTVGQANEPSFTLMWNLLILLLRQNGMVVGTDIAELLMKNQQQFPYTTSQSSVTSISNRRESLQSDEQQRRSKENTPSDPEQDTDDVTNDQDEFVEQSSKSSSLTEEEITEKFRNYLLYGNVNEALDWATDNNLWGHALFLASKVDRRSHANVMMKFANKLSLNDPLQTLYQLMSGRTPSSVTSVQDEKWGDWRPHLSMILSNTSQKPELDRKAITTLGDSLLNRGDLFAAHFCYLMAQVGFSKYPEEQSESSTSPSSVRLVLLGSSFQKPFEEFATNESIMMTEVYEYACSLNDDKFSLVEFQPYKFLLATRMLDYGHQLKCFMYMEQIWLHIQRDPTKYEHDFIKKVYELADRLKYYDPVLEKSMDEVQLDSNLNPSNEAPFEEQKWLSELAAHAAAEWPAQPQTQEIHDGYQQTSNVIDQQFTEINRQFNELNMQYENITHNPQEQYNQSDVAYYSQANNDSQVPLKNEQQFSQFYYPNDIPKVQADIGETDGMNYGNGNGYMPMQESYQSTQQQSYDQQQTQMYPSYGQDGQGHMQQQQYGSSEVHALNNELEVKSSLQPSNQLDKLDSETLTVTQNVTKTNQSTNFTTKIKPNAVPQTSTNLIPLTNLQNQQNLKNHNLSSIEQPQNTKQISHTSGSKLQQQQQQQLPYQTQTDTALPTISMPNSQSKKTGSYEDLGSASKENDGNKSNNQGSSAARSKADSKNSLKGNENSGWFGGIWNKLSLKPKNQMILPDDKNPTIVWDAAKKKWVNTDGDEQGEESLKPPPKLSELMPRMQQQNIPAMQQAPQQEEIPQQIQQVQQFPTVDQTQAYNTPTASTAQKPAELPKPPNLQSNMFKMQRNRTLKNSYVDVFNPSGAPPKPTEQVLAPSVPQATVPTGGFFIPGAPPSESAYQQTNQTAQDGAPQFYNPNQFGNYQQ